MEQMTELLQKILAKMEDLENRMAVNGKELLTSKEAAVYLGVSESRLSHMTSDGELPYYQANGRGCKRFYRKSELDECFTKVRVTHDDIRKQAATYCALHRNT